MTPQALAALHALAFQLPPPWSARDFEDFLADPACFLCATATGNAFALFRVAADEAEVLTLATHPDARRTGLARALLQAGLVEAHKRGAAQCFLEVAANNDAALALYRSIGFAQQGRRRGYYRAPPHPPQDALVLHLTLARAPQTAPALPRIILY